MRRGLISWSQKEMPIATLEARVSRLQKMMQRDQWAAVLLHTSFAHPAAVQWLTHFTPYWSEALLVVLPQGQPVLLAALTPRVHPWIREVAHLGDVVTAPHLGNAAVSYLAEHIAPDARVGVVGLGELPWATAQPLLSSAWGPQLSDIGESFAQLRQPADAAELGLAVRAHTMAISALQARATQSLRSSEWAGAIEAKARLDGAEELLQRMAPDLAQSACLQRLEGDFVLGTQRAIELSLAYKGAWVRVTHMDCVGTQPEAWRTAQEWFDQAWRTLRAPHPNFLLAPAPPGRLVQWSLQTCMGAEPLQVVAAENGFAPIALPEQTLCVLSVQLELDEGPWFASQMLLLGSSTNDSQALQESAVL